MQVVNKLTGEIYELKTDTPLDVRTSWQLIGETIKALERAKDKLKPIVIEMLDEKGQYDYGEYVFKQIPIQRMTYDKTAMRSAIQDEDFLDQLLIPDKTKIDALLKKEDPMLWPVSSVLRQTMIPVGEPFTQLRLEKTGS